MLQDEHHTPELNLVSGARSGASTLQLKMATRDPGPLAQAASKAVAGRAWDRTSTDAHQSRAGAAAPAQQVQPRIDTLWPVRVTELGKTQVSQRRQNSLNSYAVTDGRQDPKQTLKLPLKIP